MRIISGKFKGQILKAPRSKRTRPTSERLRESLFNICQSSIEGASLLDLFAGTGAIGFEALSRGASRVDFVDSSKEAIRCIKENIHQLKVQEQTQVFQCNAFIALKKLKGSYDFIYIDPPYELFSKHEKQEMIEQILKRGLLNKLGRIFLEEEKVSHAYKIEGLKCIQRVQGNTVLHHFQYSKDLLE